MLLLINKKELMGEYVNSHLFNAVALGNNHPRRPGLSVATRIGFTLPVRPDNPAQRHFLRGNFRRPDPCTSDASASRKIVGRKSIGGRPLEIAEDAIFNFADIFSHD